MSAYAILGATGNVGLSILDLLSKNPSATIHVLVRSRTKLASAFPSSSSNPQIKVFEGSISDTDTLASCLTNTKAVFLTVAITSNAPGTTLTQDTARAVVSTLTHLKAQNETFKAPKLIVLSSASVDAKFWTTTPSFIHALLWRANSHIYTDLAKAEAYLREQGDWLSATFVMPGGLVHDVRKGHELSMTKQQTFVSFLDLAAAMIEVADEETGRWDGENVSLVLRDGRTARFEWWAPLVLFRGLLSHFFPWAHSYLP